MNTCLLPAIISLFILQWNFEWGRSHKAIYFILVGIAFSIVVVSVLTKNKYLSYILDNRLLRFTGIISYSFYLIHPIVIGLTLAISTHSNKYIGASIHLALAVGLTYLTSSIIFLLLEKPYFTGVKARNRI
jgi:peptidoglycan/LPS O-acetylase OafA/YrhL